MKRKTTAMILISLTLSPALLVQPVVADLIYEILPQTLTHETDNTDQFIYGGQIVMIDGADTDGILTASELLEVTVHNSMSGTVYANDAFDFSNVNATFDGNLLNGNLRVQHTASGEAFVDWWADLENLSISDSSMSEFASNPAWTAPNTIARAAVPEPVVPLLMGAFIAGPGVAYRRRKR